MAEKQPFERGWERVRGLLSRLIDVQISKVIDRQNIVWSRVSKLVIGVWAVLMKEGTYTNSITVLLS